MSNSRLYITIGSRSISYDLWTTTAPQSYDGFGTLQIYSEGDQPKARRYVLIQEQHVQWQTMRYRSGLGAPEASDDIPENELERWVWEAIEKKGLAE